MDVPPQSRESILHALHATHPGIVKIKALIRSYVWWSNIDADIEKTVKKCTNCQQNRNEQPKTATHHWESAKRPWSRLHIDFAGPFQGKKFFLVVDSYSKWLEVSVVPSASTVAATRVLRQLFATHGLPDKIVSDNGTAFTSEEFKKCMESNLTRHIRSAPFHPATNEQAERMVQSTKNYLKKLDPSTNIDLSLARFLFNQHMTTHSTTNRSPAQLLFNRELKLYFDKIHPHEITYGKIADMSSGNPFLTVQVTGQTGPISYSVLVNDSRVVRRQDQLRNRTVSSSDSEGVHVHDENSEASLLEPTEEVIAECPRSDHETLSPALESENNTEAFTPSTPAPTPHRSNRNRQPTEFYSASGC
ncbi:PREDICTED: uncharacterized protein K02A2.6-like [Rhagoletis zephyria]|uniref:uncharacterized protein K02A2.6-like n=1 Tax=Rhagoletis zephyria TaxID=28612 RepID=UPI0008114B27|nr:PREDICTED: uncharacterized protein K02A2.6-like [Rhagoletis zephyria]